MKNEACFMGKNPIWINIFLPIYGFTLIPSTRPETLTWLKMSQKCPNRILNCLWEVISDGLCAACSLPLAAGWGQPTTTAKMHFSVLLMGWNFTQVIRSRSWKSGLVTFWIWIAVLIWHTLDNFMMTHFPFTLSGYTTIFSPYVCILRRN